MACFILTWNPGVWEELGDSDWDSFVRTGAPDVSTMTWSTGQRSSGIEKGDDLIFLRQGKRGRGILAIGKAVSTITQDAHYNDPERRANYVKVRWTSVRTIANRVPTELLVDQVPQLPWDNLQGSGVKVPDVAVEALLGLWPGGETMTASGIPLNDVEALFDEIVTHSEGNSQISSRDLAYLEKLLGTSGKPPLVGAFIRGCKASGCRIKVVKQEVTIFQGGFSAFYARGNRKEGALDLHFHGQDPRFPRLRTLFRTEELIRGYWGVNLKTPEEVAHCFAELTPKTAVLAKDSVPGAGSSWQVAPYCIYHIIHEAQLESFFAEGGNGTFTETSSWRSGYENWRVAGDGDTLIFFDHANEFVGVGWVAKIDDIHIRQNDKGQFETDVTFSGLRRLSARFDKTHLRLASDGRPIDSAYQRGYLPCHTPEDVAQLLVDGPGTDAPYDTEEEMAAFPEGKRALQSHYRRERNTKLVALAKDMWGGRERGLCCDVCDFVFAKEYGTIGQGFIEAHHRVPISELAGPTETTVADLAPVCANCHRMLHREPGLTVEQLRERLDARRLARR